MRESVVPFSGLPPPTRRSRNRCSRVFKAGPGFEGLSDARNRPQSIQPPCPGPPDPPRARAGHQGGFRRSPTLDRLVSSGSQNSIVFRLAGFLCKFKSRATRNVRTLKVPMREM